MYINKVNTDFTRFHNPYMWKHGFVRYTLVCSSNFFSIFILHYLDHYKSCKKSKQKQSSLAGWAITSKPGKDTPQPENVGTPTVSTSYPLNPTMNTSNKIDPTNNKAADPTTEFKYADPTT